MLRDGEKVTVVIPEVQLRKDGRSFRLKLSENAIAKRAVKVYCEKCLNPEIYLENA